MNNLSNESYELLADIAATASILIKFGYCEILETQCAFIDFLNKLGFTYKGKHINHVVLFELTQNITTKQRQKIIDEFNVGHEPIYRKLVMVDPGLPQLSATRSE